jgi:hypothetical protein
MGHPIRSWMLVECQPCQLQVQLKLLLVAPVSMMNVLVWTMHQ